MNVRHSKDVSPGCSAVDFISQGLKFHSLVTKEIIFNPDIIIMHIEHTIRTYTQAGWCSHLCFIYVCINKKGNHKLYKCIM